MKLKKINYSIIILDNIIILISISYEPIWIYYIKTRK